MRYIDADKLVNTIESAQQIGFGVLETQLVKDLIREQTTADVVSKEKYDRVMGNLKSVLEERREDEQVH